MKAVRFPRRIGAIWLAWLVAALILAQGQGLLHGIVHGHGVVGQHDRQVAHVGVAADAKPGHADELNHAHDQDQDQDQSGNWLLRLFAAHDGESTCRLFDQSSLGSCMPSFAASAPLLLPAGIFVDFFEARQRLPAPTVARARGPPTVR